MIDEPDEVLDQQVAAHIVSVHQRRDMAFSSPYTMPQIQRYIKYARSLKPQMTADVSSICTHAARKWHLLSQSYARHPLQLASGLLGSLAQALTGTAGLVQAKRRLVDGYKRLRTEDAVPGSSTSYRITVRQLEALVRLSEALARLRCTEKILPQFVTEVRLLLSSCSYEMQTEQAAEDGSLSCLLSTYRELTCICTLTANHQ